MVAAYSVNTLFIGAPDRHQPEREPGHMKAEYNHTTSFTGDSKEGEMVIPSNRWERGFISSLYCRKILKTPSPCEKTRSLSSSGK
jgi:hypothetical protein